MRKHINPAPCDDKYPWNRVTNIMFVCIHVHKTYFLLDFLCPFVYNFDRLIFVYLFTNHQKAMSTTSAAQFSQRRFHAGLRYPKERRSLWVALFAMVVAILILSLFSFGGAALVVLFALWGISVLVRINHSRHLGNSLRISKNQFPELAEQIVRVVQVVQAAAVQVFVFQDDKIGAYAFGWSVPQAIVVTSELVEEMDLDEFRFVTGHEMGHIALGHTRINTLIGGVFGAPAVPFVSGLLSPIFNSWSRIAEYSADRVGLVACGDLDKAVSALIKLLVGGKLASQVDIQVVIAQSQELSGRLDHRFSETWGSHPYTVHRVRELVNFWQTAECQELLTQSAQGSTAKN